MSNTKQEAHGPHRSPEKPVQINTYDYIISLIKRRKYPFFPLWKLNGYCSSFDQTWILFTQECFVSSLIEIGQVILEKKIFKFVNVFYYFLVISHWNRAWLFIWKNLYPHLRMLCSKFVWIWPSGSGEEDF